MRVDASVSLAASSPSNDFTPKRIVYPKPDIDLAGRVACVAYIRNDKTYLWPAVLYQHYSEFQLHLGDQLTKKDTLVISFRLASSAQQRKKTPLVARMLGFADDNQHVRYQEVDDQAEIYDYNHNVPSLIHAIIRRDDFRQAVAVVVGLVSFVCQGYG
jgi:hypothetical protein